LKGFPEARRDGASLVPFMWGLGKLMGGEPLNEYAPKAGDPENLQVAGADGLSKPQTNGL
jgi:hypothetical protein